MLTLLVATTALQVALWLFVLRPALRKSAQPATHHVQPVSVIVCFQNEAASLEACLRGLLDQDHPDFEVIAVDDNSEDESGAVVQRLQEEARHLRSVRPGYTRAGKKDAVTAGVREATHPLLLLTDADCVPTSREWLTRMTAPLTDHNDLVLGCSPYRRTPGLLNRWQRFEATTVALHYQGLARAGMPYMGTGRNLAYRREFFERAGGLEEHAALPGGDDDLLVNGNARSARTARTTEPEAWTVSEPTETWGDYIFQKSRHQSAGLRYRKRHQIVLLLIALSHGLFYAVGLVLLLTPLWRWALLLYGIRALAVVLAYARRPVADFYNGGPAVLSGGGAAGAGQFLRLPGVLVFDALYSVYYVFLLLASFGNRRSW